MHAYKNIGHRKLSRIVEQADFSEINGKMTPATGFFLEYSPSCPS